MIWATTCQVCGVPGTKQCGFFAGQEECTTWVCNEHAHDHPKTDYSTYEVPQRPFDQYRRVVDALTRLVKECTEAETWIRHSEAFDNAMAILDEVVNGSKKREPAGKVVLNQSSIDSTCPDCLGKRCPVLLRKKECVKCRKERM